MESTKQSTLDDIDLIKELFKLSPEYATFILSKEKRTEDILEELTDDE